MTSDRVSEETEVPDAAAALLGLFHPPPSPGTPISVPRPTAAAHDTELDKFSLAGDETPVTRVRSLIHDTSNYMTMDDPLGTKSDVVTEESPQQFSGAAVPRMTSQMKKPLDAKALLTSTEECLFDEHMVIDRRLESTPLLSTSLKTGNSRNDGTPQTGIPENMSERTAFLPSIYEMPLEPRDTQRKVVTKHLSFAQMKDGLTSIGESMGQELFNPSTWVGSLMFVLFQIVFSLTMGAAITRPHATKSMLGLFTKVASLGIMAGGPIIFITLGGEIPALYPTVDLFSAPFLANIAVVVDEAISNDRLITSDQDTDQIFLTTFLTLTALSLFISGASLIASSAFRLANLGSFLPYPVLAGFFAAVGVMTWTLAFKIDANGRSVGDVIYSREWNLIQHCFLHHLPSVVVACVMKYLGPKHPFYVVGVLFSTILIFYATMFAFGLSRQDMIEKNWFWSEDDLIYKVTASSAEHTAWSPPVPLGWINAFFRGKLQWSALTKALDPTLSLAFLYLIRCSLHAAALKRNVSNIQRISRPQNAESPLSSVNPGRPRSFSETIDVEYNAAPSSSLPDVMTIEKAKPTNVSLEDIFLQYGISQFICAVVGSFAVIPAVNASSTMFELRAEHRAPQFGNLIILLLFYMNDFRLVAYIPKPAFSSLLVLGFIDMTWTWFVRSYFKTKNKTEWLVTPLIMILAFAVGVLQSVFFGLAMSTFLFVAALFRTGVVKYVANGITIRSTVERVAKDAKWLDQNGDFIQILVLQNYLFFGNASSILEYITPYFEVESQGLDPHLVSPIPQYLILDLTLVTGMDTSAVDVFADVLNICNNHNGGLRSDPTLSSDRKLRFLSTLDGAVGKAEDLLLEHEGVANSVDDNTQFNGNGFAKALQLIDEQHGTNAATELSDLGDYVTILELDPSDILHEKHLGDRGLFFIEEGVMRIETSSDLTTTRAGSETFSRKFGSVHSAKGMSGSNGFSSIQLATAAIKTGDITAPHAHLFRIARVGPGWVLGSTEYLAGLESSASTVAVTLCSLHFISFKDIAALENDQPLLVLRLYKLLSFLLAKRQELTIGQLGTLHSIINSPPPKKSAGRRLSMASMFT